jgi:hypothetical protein
MCTININFNIDVIDVNIDVNVDVRIRTVAPLHIRIVSSLVYGLLNGAPQKFTVHHPTVNGQ